MKPQVLAGKYVVQEEIARGGMGVIYKALDRTLNRIVAVKLVHAQLSNDSLFAERFLQEARTMARLHHQNIVSIHAIEEDRGTQFLVMEFCSGSNLRYIIRTQSPLPVYAAVSLAQQMAFALAYAHTQGVIHRDIKPANVIVDRQGTAKLMDFGIAAALDKATLTSAGQVIGTPEYMSPEQARGMRLDGRSDLYSLGIVMYEMLTGRSPYAESSGTSILGQLAYDRSELELQFPGSVPSFVQNVVRDLVRQNPDERIADADTLASHLHEILHTLPQAPLPPAQDESELTISSTGPTTLFPIPPVTAAHPKPAAQSTSPAAQRPHEEQKSPRAQPPEKSLSRTPKWWEFWKRHDPPPPLRLDLPDQGLPGEPEPVLLGASAPSKVIQGQAFTARFIAYTQTAEGKVGKMLASLGPDSSIHLALKTCRWKLGTDVVVHLSGRSLGVQCPTQAFKWEGGYSLLDFDVCVANNAPLGTTTLKYDVSIHDVIVARVRLDIEVSHLRNSRTVRTTSIRPAQTAFASYAHEDRSRVLDRVAAVKISAGLDIWMDCLSLNPGEQWKARLHQEISQRDLFLLFWSRHAKESPWVSWEWHTALEEKDEPALQLHPLEAPEEAPPPEELKHLHFGDPTILARKALE